MSPREKPVVRKRDVLVLLLDIAASFGLGLALALLAQATTVVSAGTFFAQLFLALAFLLAYASHNLQGRPPLYWSHFDFLVALFFIFFVASLHYSDARAVTAESLAWGANGIWAFALGRYLFFRRLRLFNVVMLAVCAGIWVTSESLLNRITGEALSSSAAQQLIANRSLAFVVGIVLLLAQPFFLLRKPANLVYGLWAAALLGGVSLWAVQTLLELVDAWQRGALTSWSFEQGLLATTAWRILKAFPIVGGGVGTWPWLAEAYRPLGFVDLPPAPALVRMVAEWGSVGVIIFVAAWLRVPWFALSHAALFPNRRLRMAVLVFLSLNLLAAGRFFFLDDMKQPWGWTLWWALHGTFVSLVVVRDPLRIFYEPVSLASASTGQRLSPKRWVSHAVHSALRSGELAKSSEPTFSWSSILRVVWASLLILAVAIIQALPFSANVLVKQANNASLAPQEKAKLLERAVRVFPLSAEAWAKLSQSYQELASGDSLATLALAPQIEAACRRAIDLNPYQPGYYHQLAYYYADTGSAARSLEVLRAAVANNPNHLVTRLLLVRELERAQSYALASWHLRQAFLRLAPQRAELLVRLAELYELRGMRGDAVRYCQYARQGLSDTSSALLRLRRVAERLGLGRGLL